MVNTSRRLVEVVDGCWGTSDRLLPWRFSHAVCIGFCWLVGLYLVRPDVPPVYPWRK